MGKKQTKTKTKTKTLDPQRASLLGTIGGNTTVARHGGAAMGRWVNEGLARSWERKAIAQYTATHPDGAAMTPQELAQAVEALKAAHCARMRLAKAEKARQRNAKKAS